MPVPPNAKGSLLKRTSPKELVETIGNKKRFAQPGFIHCAGLPERQTRSAEKMDSAHVYSHVVADLGKPGMNTVGLRGVRPRSAASIGICPQVERRCVNSFITHHHGHNVFDKEGDFSLWV